MNVRPFNRNLESQMPTSLPDKTTRRPSSPPAHVTRRAFLRLLVPVTPTTFTALADTDIVQRWLRCSFAAPLHSPG